MFFSLKSLLQQSMSRHHVERQWNAYGILDKTREALEQICPQIAEYASPKRVKDGSVFIHCDGAVVAQEIALHRKELLEKINGVFSSHGSFSVKQTRVQNLQCIF